MIRLLEDIGTPRRRKPFAATQRWARAAGEHE